ncbi:MAG TPA: hemolysin III family protein [Thermoanaerobaculia bacterium]|jgi:hemolysin III|nr:hemolysin III family protein [Thermoanaerobaculia bacterium]
MYAGERFNSITHIAGSVLAIIGTVVAIESAVTRGRDGETITAVAIYGAMMIVLYLSSTLYHSLRGRAKNVFHVFDHCAIYLLIAGTYTPITLITLRGRWGWWLFGIVWTLAIAGVLKDTLLRGRYRPLSVVLYVLMGWLVVIAIQPLRAAMPSRGIVWLAAGGLAYTLGIVFFALSKHVVHAHGVWHLCVIGGSACHYVAVTRYVLL